MRVTFLGHQGWQFENDRGHSFLLDPIAEEMGNGDSRLPVWPPRRLDFEKMAPIDAVIVSHEHADHFSLDTLNRLPRRCRILISDLASYAMACAIEELGFKIERFTALHPFSLCGLKVTPLPALYNTLEPDVYALLVEDDSRASFLTAIDTVPHPDLFGWLATHCPRRTLDNLTNNFVESRHALVEDENAYRKSKSIVAKTTLEFIERFHPQRVVVAGQGWSFQGDKTALNHSYFSVDNHWLSGMAQSLAPHIEWFEGKPGMRFTLHGDDMIVDVATVATHLPAVDREFAPRSVNRNDPFPPWTGRREAAPEELNEVRRFVCEEFGAAISTCAPKLMETLYYLKGMETDRVAPTFALKLRNGAAALHFEFDYGFARFREVKPDKATPAAIGIEVWAPDFKHLIDAREEVFMVYETAIRPWSHVPALVPVAALIESLMSFTPRFRPKATLDSYRESIGRLADNLKPFGLRRHSAP